MNSHFDYLINKTWNNLELDHVPAKISFQTPTISTTAAEFRITRDDVL